MRADVAVGMYPCPHCGEKTFRLAAKACSWMVLPAMCRKCGGLCFAPGSPGGVLLVLNVVLLTLAGFVASWLHSVVPLAIAAAIAVVLWLWRLHFQPLLALSREQCAAARKQEGIWWLVYLLLSAVQ